MNDFFSIYTHTPWDNLRKNELIEVRLFSLKSIFKSFPVIESMFFDVSIPNAGIPKRLSALYVALPRCSEWKVFSEKVLWLFK